MRVYAAVFDVAPGYILPGVWCTDNTRPASRRLVCDRARHPSGLRHIFCSAPSRSTTRRLDIGTRGKSLPSGRILGTPGDVITRSGALGTDECRQMTHLVALALDADKGKQTHYRASGDHTTSCRTGQTGSRPKASGRCPACAWPLPASGTHEVWGPADVN